MEARALALALELRTFNVDQPRVPAGDPDGGQWTSGGAGGDGARVELVQDRPTRRYTVDLEEEERRGGHTIREHVGKTDQELLSAAGEERHRADVEAGAAVGRGSFDSKISANDFVNRVLQHNTSAIDLVAAGTVPRVKIDERFGYVTGKEAVWNDPATFPYMRKTYYVRVIVVHDSRVPSGYRVLTAFPINANPIN